MARKPWHEINRDYAEAYLPLLYNALEEELGIYVKTDQQGYLVNTLYWARDDANDPALAELMLFKIGDDVVYIAKRSTELPDA
jgi:hypothetical protein